MPQAPLQYLQRSEIDNHKWDRCIDTASNGLIYGYSWWLDRMARNWDALVWEDYEAVLPLTWHRKWGIRYLYQPAFTQQLGIFSRHTITPELQDAFLQELQGRFRFAEIFLNYGHPLHNEHRSNFILPLQAGYHQLKLGYKAVLLKNLKRAAKLDMQYSTTVQAAVVLKGYIEMYGDRMPHVSLDDFDRFRQLCMSNLEHVITRAVLQEGQLLCAVLLLRDRKRMYLLQAVTWPAGRKAQANHLLFDRLLHEFAGSGLVFDFEGSDLPGVANFYKNFGSIDQPYFFYRFNRLPLLFRWLK